MSSLSVALHVRVYSMYFFCLLSSIQIDWGIEPVSANDADNIDWGREGEETPEGIDWGDSGEALDWSEGAQTSTEDGAIDWGDDGTADKEITLEQTSTEEVAIDWGDDGTAGNEITLGNCGITVEESGQGKQQH